MFSGIRWRLVGSYFLLTAITTLVLGVTLLSILKGYFLQQEKAQLLQNAKALASRADQLLAKQDLNQLATLVSAYSLLSQARICVLDKQHRPLLDSWENSSDQSIGFSLMESRREGGGLEIGFESVSTSSRPYQPPTILVDVRSPWGGYTVLEEPTQVHSSTARSAPRLPTPTTIEVQVPIPGPTGPLGYIQVSRGATRGQQLLQTIRVALLWASLAALLLALSMGLWISGGLTAPLAELASVAKAMARGDLHVRAPDGRQDEIGELAQQFNQMAASLEGTFAALAADRDALRRFAADASHELRTPIAALKTFNELLLDQAQDDPQARREFLEESQQQIARLGWLTENLLQLSRLDSGLLEMERAEHDLAELVNRVVATFLPQAKEKGVALTVLAPEGSVRVRCDERWIEQAISNLLSNALKFTPAGGCVTAGVARLAETAEVWVEDTGIGVAAEDLPHIFERFYRAKGNGEKGSGLGLAIAQAIIQAHNGQIQVSSQVGKGSRFSFRLPL